jgi:Kef-type K+ transport system membrane component KefB/nucleotide-binding universal stress UspA family protein
METGAPEQGFAVAERSRWKTFVLYGGLVFLGFVIIQLVLHAGHGLHAPKPVGVAAAKKASGASTEDIVWRLLLAATVVIVVARLVGAAFQRIHQPQVVGEIVAGILLGPSVFGHVAPGLSHQVFSPAMLPFLDVLAQVGLIFFMFLIGLELDVRLIRGRGQTAAFVSHVSIIAPFVLGGALALALFPTLGSESGRFTPFALFLGASMSITAFPVLARILTERGIYKTPLGAVTLTCAAVDDVTAWCMLAVVVAIARANGATSALITIALSASFIAFMVLAVRPALARVARYHEERGTLAGGMLALLFVGILLSALATDRIGIHAIFGAFLFGAIMPQRSELIVELVQKLEDFTVVFLLPLFFAFTGLRTNIGLIGSDPKLWVATGLVLLVAIAGKWGGSSLAAKVMGLGWRESMAVGVLMNTRGLTELIILNIGLDLKVIPPTLFAILVIMALVTTFMTTPLLSVFYPPRIIEQMAQEAEGREGDEEGPHPFRVLIPVSKTSSGSDLVVTALQLVREHDEKAQITLLRTVQAPGSAYRAGPRQYEAMLSRAAESLRPLVQLIEGAGHEAVPLVVPTSDVRKAIVDAAKRREPDLVLLGYARSLWGDRLLSGTVGEVLRDATTDVAVLVDPAGRGTALDRGAKVLVPYGGGYHEDVGLELALRLADASGGSVTLFGPAEGENDARELADRAARAYEETGVWTVPISTTGEPSAALVEQLDDADLVVLGVGDEWVRNKQSLGGLRESIAARSTAPLLIVRRHGQKGRLRRQREWIVDTGEMRALSGKGDVVDLTDDPVANDLT